MAGTRSDGIINESTILQVQFLKNGSNYVAHSVIKVTIHDDYTEAQNNQDIKQTIQSNRISHLGDGLYQYTASDASYAGTYFDKIFLIPDDGQPVWTDIHSFYVRRESYGSTAPGEIETCKIVLNVFDCVANAQKGDKVYIEMNEKVAWYGKNLIEKEREMFTIDENGMVTMYLIETDTLTQDTGTDIYYTIHVTNRTYNAGDYEKMFTVPKGTIDANLVDLPTYTP